HLKDEYQSELEAVKKDLGVSQLPKKAGDLSRPQAKAQPKAESLRRLTEYRFLRDHEPAPVSPANLARFVAALPSWIREGLDPLPPDAARRRLQVLYRLVFPPGEEIPAPAPTAAAPSAPEAKRSVGTKPESVPPSSPSNPF
ncbi:MAG: hypothetical protein IRY99_27960, partial [Isosphaeraceae bacterium]|nr:hypothetical protein [Isosphaeraceae bacterium]